MRKETPKLSETTAEKILSLILDQRAYPPGSKLPGEHRLAQSLGVSRTTIREAVSRLASQGILEVRRGLGTFVSEELPKERGDISKMQRPSVKRKARDLFEMRLIFEPVTAALACERASDEEIEEIARLAEEVKRCAESGGDWAKADQAFHFAIIRASHNEYMKRLYPIINEAVGEIMQRGEDHEEKKRLTFSDNMLIVEFLRKRDAKGAQEAMGIHMRHMINMM